MQTEYTPKTALTHALKQNGYKISAVKVNKILHRNGIICKKVRMSTTKPDEKRTWWALTERGVQFGENIQSTRSVETIIYYRLDKFNELMYMIGINHNTRK